MKREKKETKYKGSKIQRERKKGRKGNEKAKQMMKREKIERGRETASVEEAPDIHDRSPANPTIRPRSDAVGAAAMAATEHRTHCDANTAESNARLKVSPVCR